MCSPLFSIPISLHERSLFITYRGKTSPEKTGVYAIYISFASIKFDFYFGWEGRSRTFDTRVKALCRSRLATSQNVVVSRTSAHFHPWSLPIPAMTTTGYDHQTLTLYAGLYCSRKTSWRLCFLLALLQSSQGTSPVVGYSFFPAVPHTPFNHCFRVPLLTAYLMTHCCFVAPNKKTFSLLTAFHGRTESDLSPRSIHTLDANVA